MGLARCSESGPNRRFQVEQRSAEEGLGAEGPVSKTAEGPGLEHGQRRRGIMRQQVAHLRGEAEYSHELDVELFDRASRLATLEERRHRLQETLHIHSPAVLDALAKFGYDPTTAVLVFVAPLVQVAWAAGPPTKAVRRHITETVRQRGVETTSPAYERLLAWLDRRPSDELFEKTLGAIAEVFAELSPDERLVRREKLLSACRETAAVHCRVLGWFHRICAEKKKVIAQISRRIGAEPQAPS